MMKILATGVGAAALVLALGAPASATFPGLPAGTERGWSGNDALGPACAGHAAYRIAQADPSLHVTYRPLMPGLIEEDCGIPQDR